MFYISFPLYFFSRPNYNAWQVRKNSPQTFCSWYLISSESRGFHCWQFHQLAPVVYLTILSFCSVLKILRVLSAFLSLVRLPLVSKPQHSRYHLHSRQHHTLLTETALVLLARVLPRPLNPPGPTFADRTGDLDPGLLTGSS